MASLGALPALAEQILADVAAQLVLQGVAVPDRRYVQAGSQPAWDGEQMTCGLMGVAQGQPGRAWPQTFAPEALNLYATLFILLVREIAITGEDGFLAGQIPTAAQQDADGHATIGDAQALVIAASTLHRQYLLTGPGEGFVIDGLQPLGPEGGLVGSRLLVSVSLS